MSGMAPATVNVLHVAAQVLSAGVGLATIATAIGNVMAVLLKSLEPLLSTEDLVTLHAGKHLIPLHTATSPLLHTVLLHHLQSPNPPPPLSPAAPPPAPPPADPLHPAPPPLPCRSCSRGGFIESLGQCRINIRLKNNCLILWYKF